MLHMFCVRNRKVFFEKFSWRVVHEGKRREKETRDLKVIYNSSHVGHDKERRKLRWDYPYRGRVFDEEQEGEGNTRGLQHGLMGKCIIMIATTDLYHIKGSRSHT